MIKKDEIAYLLLRVTLGANIFLHGFSRLIGNRVAFATHIENERQNTRCRASPSWLVGAAVGARYNAEQPPLTADTMLGTEPTSTSGRANVVVSVHKKRNAPPHR
jgi:hypothetical protein